MIRHDLFESLQTLIQDIDRDSCAVLIGELEKMKALAYGRMLQRDQPPPLQPDTGRYLTVKQVCERFNVMPKWLYRHKKQMPYSQPSRKVLLFQEQAVTRWFATRKGGC